MTLLDASASPRSAAAPAGSGLPSLVAASAALLALYLLWGAVDGRAIAGDPVWVKPAKFALSFVVFFGTLALVEARLSRPWATGWTLRLTTAAMAAAFVVEMAYMTYQAARGEASHFNLGTPFHAQMYQVMAIGAVTLIAGVGIYGGVALADRAARMSPALRLAVGLGFLATVVLTLPTAFTLGGNGGHFVGVPPEGAATIPLFGWSAAVGDLRPAHFLALHAMQALPLFVLARERGGRAVPSWHVIVATAAWAVVTVAVFVQALAGLPLVRL